VTWKAGAARFGSALDVSNTDREEGASITSCLGGKGIHTKRAREKKKKMLFEKQRGHCSKRNTKFPCEKEPEILVFDI